jgi:hypothetical protein
MAKPPPVLKTGNTVLCELSLASSVEVRFTPSNKADAASLATRVLPRSRPCWSGQAKRTVSTSPLARRCANSLA